VAELRCLIKINVKDAKEGSRFKEVSGQGSWESRSRKKGQQGVESPKISFSTWERGS